MKRLEPFVKEAARSVIVAKSRGRPKPFGLAESTMIILFVIFINNSNKAALKMFHSE